MKRLVLLVVSLVTAASLCAAAVPKTSYVNPFVGTRGYGHAHPAAMRPFGMVQAGPDNGRGWPFCSGYNRKSKSVRGFSQRHLSGTGIPDYGEVSLLPFRGAFAAVHAAAEADWERHLSRVEAEGPDADKRTFYSMLYRALGQPNLMSDVGEDDLYTTFSIWDGCRAAFPLYALVAPERIPAFVRSFMHFYRQHGWMPVFCIGDWDTQCMIGTHSVAILERWRECGLGADTDWAAVCAAVVDTLRNRKQGRQKGRWDILDRYGYLPYDKILDEGVSRTMEACLDDAAAARMSRAFGRSADAAFLAARAENWTNVFDRALLLARGRDSKGAWREPFQPFANGCASRMRCDFCEANAYTYTWHVMQDVEGLVAAFGGKAVFGERLDAVFSLPTDVPGCARDGDVTGLIGQYPHGCDAAHHIPYCFRFSDRPWRTDELVGEICRRFYSAKDDGLCGNDDCGELSGWYVFAAAGFFPLDPSDSNYVVGSPQLDGVTFHLPDGKTFAVRRRGRSVAGKVPTVLLNGVPLATWRFPHAAVAAGGELTVSYR